MKEVGAWHFENGNFWRTFEFFCRNYNIFFNSNNSLRYLKIFQVENVRAVSNDRKNFKEILKLN